MSRCTAPLENITREPRFRSVGPCSRNAYDVTVSQRRCQGADRKAIASTITHATITSEVMSPAVILAFSFRVVG